ncbi:NosD domain-containing protein [Geobacillus sp. FSL W8-0032]|uniref:Periplasmic copper-binding protein NosD beta helix domain-containing protein n=1 Tax=Geobacillus subterraneus TaxID=129338 RepID=A0A679FN93_9BACL|nr:MULTISPECIES: NosD domain-containing protein [Geobacillus]KYD28985.1 hypothetical protein B4113_2699 [Geobacillus sp. B4113_201601]BBW96439.1 hypothetical protein GsuE55_12720 [Geobacillus subterraneus]
MRTLGWICFFVFVLPLSVHAKEIQTIIDQTPDYGIVKMASGVYDESLILSKPLTLEGVGRVTIRSCRLPAVVITGHHVVLRNIMIQQCRRAESAALVVTGHDHIIEYVQIVAAKRGIQLNQASRTSIAHCLIRGTRQENGIDLWDSSQNIIKYNTIKQVKDGIYIENSNKNEVNANCIHNSRYGIHVMFSDDLMIKRNLSEHNLAGAMIMGTKRTVIEHNSFRQNNRHVHSQGLLLYNAMKTSVTKNVIAANRVGVYAENAYNVQLTGNYFLRNAIGMQWNISKKNYIADNSFVGNVYDAQAIRCFNNTIIHNYWDTSLKLDQTGRGFSAIPYRADPFFLALTANVPEYQLFFQAPGMLVLQKLLRSPDDEVMIDHAPRMNALKIEQTHRLSTDPLNVNRMSLVMIVGSISLLIMGRKRG